MSYTLSILVLLTHCFTGSVSFFEFCVFPLRASTRPPARFSLITLLFMHSQSSQKPLLQRVAEEKGCITLMRFHAA